MKNLVVDYLICEGYREAAELLCTDAAIPFPKDAVENLDARMAIRDAIIGGRVSVCLAFRGYNEKAHIDSLLCSCRFTWHAVNETCSIFITR